MDAFKSMLDTLSKAGPNIGLGPSADFIVKGMVHDWCKANPLPNVIDENDSWHWSIVEMHFFYNQLGGKEADLK